MEARQRQRSIIDPCTCGFAKIAAYSVFTSNAESGNLQLKLDTFLKYFDNREKFSTKLENFKYFKAIVANIRNVGKRNFSVQKDLMTFFGNENWRKLNIEEKEKHQLFSCEACFKSDKYKAKLSLFKLSKQNKNAISQAKCCGLSGIKNAYEKTKAVVKTLDEEYKAQFGHTFTEIHADIIKNENTKVIEKKERSVITEFTKSLKKKWEETSVLR